MTKLILLLGILLSLNSYAYLGQQLRIAPQNNYQRIETEHFEIVYPENLKTEAEHTAGFCEKIHAKLSEYFGYEFHRKTTFILADNEDQANGITTAIGHQGIILYMAAPEPYVSIGEYGHWLENLIIHEYTHYITLDRAKGFFAFTRYLFGDLLLPNHLWPDWLAEGLAVFAETRFTKAGRGHGDFYTTLIRDGLYRASGNGPYGYPITFDQLSGPNPKLPFGETGYFAGYGIMSEIERQYGDSALSIFVEESSYRVPFFLNGTLENMTVELGKKDTSFRKVWENWLSSERTRMSNILEWLKTDSTKEPEFLTEIGSSSSGARISPDGKYVAYFYSSGHEGPQLNLMELSTKKITKLDDTIGNPGLAWTEDSNFIYYSKHDSLSAYANSSEIYKIDIRNKNIIKVTENARAKDPDLCSNNTIVYTSRSGRFSFLKSIDLNSKKINIIYQSPEYYNVSNPRCSADGSKIYFSEHSNSPKEYVMVVATKGGVPNKIIASDKFRALFPDPQANGDIYFTKAQDGFYDLAKYNAKNNNIQTLARSSGGYWMPRVNKDKIAVTYFSSLGKFVTVSNLTDYSEDISEIVNSPNFANKNEKIHQYQFEQSKTPPVISNKETSSYFFASDLLPRIWSPILSYSRDRKTAGAILIGWDSVDSFSYELDAFYDSLAKTASGAAGISTRFSGYELSTLASSQMNAYAIFSDGSSIYSLERSYGISVSRPIVHSFYLIQPQLSAEWARTTYGGTLVNEVALPETRVQASIQFDSRKANLYSITQEKGLYLSLAAKKYFVTHKQNWKFQLISEPIFQVFPHHGNLDIKAIAAYTPKFDQGIPGSVLLVGGKPSNSELNLPLRGYTLGFFKSRAAAVIQTEYRFPFNQIFNGYDTWPLFLRNIGGYAFYDTAKIIHFKGTRSGMWSAPVSSLGGGFIANTHIGYHLPFSIRLEFAHGIVKEFNGEDSIALYFGN